MAETKFIDAAGLQRFKTNQDAFNLTQFVALDANGNHITCPSEVQGEVGKIYIDLESGSKDHYVYDAASGDFMLLSPDIATEADINAMF